MSRRIVSCCLLPYGNPKQPFVIPRLETTRFFSKKRKKSSRQWLERHVKDPYVKMADKDGIVSRAHYKLEHMDRKYRLVKKESVVIDLGAAPGGWTAYAAANGARVLAFDLLSMDENVSGLPNVDFIQGDFTKELGELQVTLAGDVVDLVMSDMAPNFVGDKRTDAIRTSDLCEQALEFSIDVLTPGGAFVGKYFSGPEETMLKDLARQEFRKVATVKPPASRKESSERFLLATGKL